MAVTTVAESGEHRNLLLDDAAVGQAVQANQHVIVHGNEAMLLDPGGSKTFRKAYPELLQVLGRSKLTTIFFSHQDPDIVAAANGWLVSTEATAYVSALWVRFVPHFGVDRLVAESLKPIPDEGMVLPIGGTPVVIIPAHFLHSVGNFQVYDPVTRVLYTGDLGASLGHGYQEVSDFDAHLQYMEGFHKRYMTAGKAMTAWAAMARKLDIEVIAPQHGALFRGKQLVTRFIDWADGFACGVDLIDSFELPPGSPV